jgi:spermidine/putrescine-binding protein
MALSGPLKFTNSVNGNVVTIIYNGKAYSVEDNPDKQITDIFDNNYNLGLRTTYSGNITLLDGSVT